MPNLPLIQHINSTNIHDPPTIDPRIADLRWGKNEPETSPICPINYFFLDFDVLYYGTRFIRKWIQTKPLADLIDEMISPPESLKEDGEWTKFVKSVVRVCILRVALFHCSDWGDQYIDNKSPVRWDTSPELLKRHR